MKCGMTFIVAFGLLAACGGCEFNQALIDGAYGGVSDTVAGAISGIVLGVLGL